MSVYLLSPDNAFIHCMHSQFRNKLRQEMTSERATGYPKPLLYETNRCRHHQAYLPRSSTPEFPLLEQTNPRHPSCHPTRCRWKIRKAGRCPCPTRASSCCVQSSGTVNARAFRAVLGLVGNSRHLRPTQRTISKRVRSNRNGRRDVWKIFRYGRDLRTELLHAVRHTTWLLPPRRLRHSAIRPRGLSSSRTGALVERHHGDSFPPQ